MQNRSKKLTKKQQEAQDHFGYERPEGYDDFEYADHVRACLERDGRSD